MHKIFVFLSILMMLLLSGTFATLQTAPYSLAALTWNMGNKTASDGAVKSLSAEIKFLGLPDIVAVGTQEELAAEGQKLKDKLVKELNSTYSAGYKIAAEKSYTTSAGANNSLKTAVLSGAQKTPISKTLNLSQNRTSLSFLIKKDVTLDNIHTEIYYPPEKDKGNNAVILIKGNLTKGTDTSNALTLRISNVHLNSGNDQKRRLHVNVFFDQEKFSLVPKKYEQILTEAKQFDLIMGDFNERDYLMANNSIVDRGYLTNFVAYGFDFSQRQERRSMVYGTYGFTKLGNTTPVVSPDPRGRPHNAKGGFLDRIAFTSGGYVESKPTSYGAVVNGKEFSQKNKLLYAGSDHLPIIRHFVINFISGEQEEKVVVRSVKRRLPTFKPDIEELDQFIKDKGKDNRFMFYDSAISKRIQPKPLSVQEATKKREDLQSLEKKLNDLKTKMDNSTDHGFLVEAYNIITTCNQSRNKSLEAFDDTSIEWFVPASLTQSDYKKYQEAIEKLLKYKIP